MTPLNFHLVSFLSLYFSSVCTNTDKKFLTVAHQKEMNVLVLIYFWWCFFFVIARIFIPGHFRRYDIDFISMRSFRHFVFFQMFTPSFDEQTRRQNGFRHSFICLLYVLLHTLRLDKRRILWIYIKSYLYSSTQTQTQTHRGIFPQYPRPFSLFLSLSFSVVVSIHKADPREFLLLVILQHLMQKH